jgi:hypothetical protein
MVARGGDATTLRQRSKLTRSTPHFYKRTCLLREFQSITSLGRMRAERGEIESSVVVVASADDAAGSMMTVRVRIQKRRLDADANDADLTIKGRVARCGRLPAGYCLSLNFDRASRLLRGVLF